MANRTATGKLKIDLQATIVNTLDNLSTTSHIVGATNLFQQTLADGVSANQINRAWASEGRELASSASETIDLYDYAGIDIGAGSGADALGQALTMEEIVVVCIKQLTGPGRLEVIPAVSNGWSPIGSHTVATGGALKAGGGILKWQTDTDAYDVADGSNHRITLTANGGDVTYSIYVLGRHDDDESSSSSSSSSSSTSTLSSSSSSTSSSLSSTSTLSSSSSSTSSSLSSSSST